MCARAFIDNFPFMAIKENKKINREECNVLQSNRKEMNFCSRGFSSARLLLSCYTSLFICQCALFYCCWITDLLLTLDFLITSWSYSTDSYKSIPLLSFSFYARFFISYKWMHKCEHEPCGHEKCRCIKYKNNSASRLIIVWLYLQFVRLLCAGHTQLHK